MPMSRPVAVGDIFNSASPDTPDLRIIVLGLPVVHGAYGHGTVGVGTIDDNGRVTRQRRVQCSKFHDTAVTNTGTVRKSGYVLASEW